MTVRLVRIDLFPIKSFDPVSVEAARVLPSGALDGDRRFAVFDERGKVVNGKRTPLVHSLAASFDAGFASVTLTDRRDGRSGSYPLSGDRAAIDARLSEHFGLPVSLREDAAGGFPDDTLAAGPTVVSVETLAVVAGWFGLSADEARLRFRANLIVEGGGPLWEDRLFGAPGDPVGFRVGGVTFFGTNPCARCVVPGRHPETAAPTPLFAKTFAVRRRETLPAWAEPEAFDHFFRLAVNTRLYAPAAGGTIRVGDPVELAGA